MSYPILTARGADLIAETLTTATQDEQWASHIIMCDGADFDHREMAQIASSHRIEWLEVKASREAKGEDVDEYFLEAFMASRLHSVLRGLPMDLLQEIGFWRYLALFPYRWYLQLREGGPTGLDIKPQDYGGTKIDEGGRRSNTTPKYQLILRTFLWGKAACDEKDSNVDPYRRATIVNETGGAVTDVWHSHIVRIQLGQLGRLPHAFLDSICDTPTANSSKKKGGARSVEKRLTRMKHTVLFDLYELDEARKLTDHEKSIVLSEVGDAV